LVVTTTAPTGDLAWRLAMPASAPIAPNPDDPSARLGIAEGHTKDYGRYLVGTGPYMFEGTDQLDFSVPPDEQEQVAGYIPGRQIVLVRNPSWDPATPEQLGAWRYEITSVPRVDAELDACKTLPVGEERTQCWADFDRFLMEEVVAYVPRTYTNINEIYSANVVNHSYGEFAMMTSFDHMAVAPSS